MLGIYQRTGGKSCFHFQGGSLTLIIKSSRSSTMSVNLYRTARLHMDMTTSNLI